MGKTTWILLFSIENYWKQLFRSYTTGEPILHEKIKYKEEIWKNEFLKFLCFVESNCKIIGRFNEYDHHRINSVEFSR